MITTSHEIPFFRLPVHEDLLLFLIQKELQGTRFTLNLHQAGFDDSLYQPDLGHVVLTLMGFTHRTDALWEWYFMELEACAEQVDLQDVATARAAALEFYSALKRKLESIVPK